MKTLQTHQDWLDMEVGEKATINGMGNVIILRVPTGWIYNEYSHCDKLDTTFCTNTFIPLK